ncbi:hypothetical protein [Desulfopila aestuarii]|uniref:Methyl-accepting chemotaxis protein n=1 Tax=Desulfopila aestuarii DSM 18488 TaxID=1121416 RepID=A0A1M7YMH4_9BACT|nr:hypothetical protein [Desulfopila aestuarii]SHO53814.1 methyl-accepting chemotaxis protein [Desulfopila aestuarii DSM 18488]
MKSKFQSISFKLLSTGLLAVLLPLVVVGYFSVNKSAEALLNLSREKTQSLAIDLSLLVKNLLNAQKEMVGTLAVDPTYVQALQDISLADQATRQHLIRSLFENIEVKFQRLNSSQQYQGIFFAGNLATHRSSGGSHCL